MLLSRNRAMLIALASTLVVSGCDALIGQPAPAAQEPTDFSTIRLADTDVLAARPACAAVMKERFRIDNTASTATVIVSQPQESSGRADDEPAAVRERISGASNRHRQIAQIRLVERGPDVLVLCHVQVQRLDVSERAAFAPQRSSDDRPANQPTDPYASDRARMEQEWTNVGRNRQLERAMLDEIGERLVPTTRPG